MTNEQISLINSILKIYKIDDYTDEKTDIMKKLLNSVCYGELSVAFEVDPSESTYSFFETLGFKVKRPHVVLQDDRYYYIRGAISGWK